MEPLSHQNFLTQISAIIRQYSKIAELTGENFNVFNILGLTSNEVRTHSAFIAELLNPKGSHGKKDTFLNLFIQQMEIEDFIPEDAKVIVEKHVGYISSDNTEGGNIDIIAIDKDNRAVIIENKIYAPDQLSQLLRYYNYGKKYHSNSFRLMYLTLDGKDAAEGSKGELKELQYDRISYSQGILNWMEKCKEKSVDHPILRETITQYIYLIRLLTGQTTNNAMANEIVTKIVSNQENLSAFLTLIKSDLVLDVKKELLERLKKQIVAIAEELKMEHSDFDPNFGFARGETYFHFYLPQSANKKYHISIGFNGALGQFLYGIDCSPSHRNDFRDQIAIRLGKSPIGWTSWVWVSDFEYPYNNWNNSEPWLAIDSGAMKTSIKDKVDNIKKNMEGLDLL